MPHRPAAVSSRRPLTILLFLLLLAYIAWMLSLPAWPSQDGPVHLYYTKVLDALFSGVNSPFRPYFFVKHLLPPYALYYYSLLGFSHLVPLLVADRLVICGYLVLFVLGFRYAARAIGPTTEATSLLASLLTLNWALGMGFTNYCLSLALALWAIGVWLRLGEGPALGKRIAFVALVVLITLTHPVPLLVVLAFGGVDLVCRFIAAGRERRRVLRPSLWAGVITLFCGALCLLYVKAFTVRHPLAQRSVMPGTPLQHVVRRIKDLLIVKNVELLYGHWWIIQIYRVALGLILLAAIVMTILQWRRNRSLRVWTAGDSMSVFATMLLLLLPLLPSDISGAYYFFERLNLLLWLTFLLSASGWSAVRRAAVPGPGVAIYRQDPRKAQFMDTAVVVFTVVIAGLLLFAANGTLRPFAEHDYLLAHTELPLKGQFAMVLDGERTWRYQRAGPPWDPYYWDMVELLRRNDGLMLNAPWLDSPIIPLAETSTFPGVTLTPKLANSPLVLSNDLQTVAGLRENVLDRAEVALFSLESSGYAPDTVPKALGTGWRCEVPAGAQYRICRPLDPPTEALSTRPQRGDR